MTAAALVNNRFLPRAQPGADAGAGPWDENAGVVFTDNLSWNVVVGANTMAGAERFRVVGDARIEGKLTVTGLIDPTGLVVDEQATVPGGAPAASKGTFWVKDDTPNRPYFTDDAGTDHDLLSASAGPWTLNGTTVYPDNTAWNVVVGATAMSGSEKLRVVGSTYLDTPLGVGTNPAGFGGLYGAGIRHTLDAGAFGAVLAAEWFKNGAGALTTVNTFVSRAIFAGSGTVADYRHYWAQTPVGGGDTVTNCYGLYIDDQAAAATVTNGFGIWQVGASDLNSLQGDTVIGAAAMSGGEKLRVVGDARIEGTLTVGGRVVAPYNDTGAPKTANYNAAIDDFVRVDPSGGPFSVTLPTAVGVKNRGITIKNVTSSANAVTFNTTAGQTIDDIASGVDKIASAYENVTVISDGANWMRFPKA